jgi:hypothetical protein
MNKNLNKSYIYNLINIICLTYLIYLLTMDFTPEWKLVRAACLLNEFLNENHRNFYKNFRSVQQEFDVKKENNTYIEEDVTKKKDKAIYENNFPPLTPFSKFNKSYFKRQWSDKTVVDEVDAINK